MSPQRADLAFDRRITSHMSAGMSTYVRQLEAHLPRVAPDLKFAFFGAGDNFDLWEQATFPLALARTRPKLAHIPSPFVPLLMPVPYVVTIHDLIDLHYPQFGKGRVGPYYRLAVAPVARRARAVITDDEMTADDLERFLGVNPRRIRIIPLGVDLPQPLLAPFVHPRPYFLYVGNRRPHKNLATLFEAWSTLPPSCVADVFLTGDRDDASPVPDRGESGSVVFLGTRTDKELVAYYGGAAAYVHPALREGFGLPLLEAMRVGAPVIAAHGALPRVLAAHAFGFEAFDKDELRELLQQAISERDLFARGAQAARTATASLTWEATAQATVAVYREFL
jgi:glycosyltransferase involved in cell wall biosynthesis